MKLNHLGNGDVQALMQEPVASANSPQRRGPYLICGALPAVLHDAVTGANVVQSEIAERMDYLVPESYRNRKRSAINGRSRRSSLEGARMTNRASYRCE